MSKQFRSNAESIKYYVKSLLDSEARAFSRRDIEEYLRENDPKGMLYSPGTISGALRSLTYNSTDYLNVERGKYQRALPEDGGTEPDIPLRSKVQGILKQARQSLLEACTMNALYMSEEDRRTVDEVREILAYLDNKTMQPR